MAHAQRLAQATRLLSGWGLKFFDYDNDGRPRPVARQRPSGRHDRARTRPQVTYKEPLLLFHNEGGRSATSAPGSGPAFKERSPRAVSRSATINNDGRLDVLVGNNGGAPLLLRNHAGASHHWVGLKLQGVTCNRDAIGARITWSAGGKRHPRFKTGGGSYLSSHDPREVLGLGAATTVDWVEIAWPAPSTRVDRFTTVKVDAYQKVVEGKGIV